MLGIGVDICEVKRFDRLQKNEKFIKKVFTELEIKYCEKKNKGKSQSFAARFAAKEAFVKALGTGFRKGTLYKEIEVNNDDLGKPYLNITGTTYKTLKNMNGGNIYLSLSHEKKAAVAFVVIEKGIKNE